MLEFSLDKDNENRLMVYRNAYERLQVTFRVQPLFGIGDRDVPTNEKVTKKRTCSSLRDARIALARC